MPVPWRIAGDFVLSCNCDVFCPCVLSLGKARPSAGVCYSWWALRIIEGHAGATPLGGLNVVLLLEVPGPMEQGGWRLGLYIDERATPSAVEALIEILTGRAGGPIGWFSMVIEQVLGTKQVPISIEPDGRGWRATIPRILDGAVEPIPGTSADGLVRIVNSRYWVAPDLVVATGTRSRIRDWGRNWDFAGRSAECARFDWSGP